MADVTISSLPLGTPSGSALLPYSQSGTTLAVSPSALLQNVGNIGIGTSTPNGTLAVIRNGGNGIILQSSATSPNTSILLSANYNNTGRVVIGASSEGVARPGLSIVTGDAERLTIDSQGDVSIPGKLTNAGVAKAWVNFDGTKNTSGSVSITNTDRLINQSSGVSSVTRTGLGTYRINFNIAMNNNNYFVIANGFCNIGARTVNVQPAEGTFTVNNVTVASVLNSDLNTYDAPIVSVLIYGT